MGLRSFIGGSADRGDGETESLKEQFSRLLKGLAAAASRPLMEVGHGDEQAEIQVPKYPVSMNDLFWACRECSVMATSQVALRGEILRRGYEWVDVYTAKCTNEQCNEEFEDIDPSELCPKCQSPLEGPPADETTYAEALLQKCNANNQEIIDVFGEMEDQVNTYDDQYMIVLQRYDIDDKTAEIKTRQVVEILAGDPRRMRMVARPDGTPGGLFYTCLEHRDVHLRQADAKCPKCGKPLYDVHFVSIQGGGTSDQDVESCYIEDEVSHASKYKPTVLYGQGAPPMVLWHECTALIFMVRWIRMAWEKGRLPKGVLAVTTMNPDNFRSEWIQEAERVRQDPHHIPVMTVEPTTTSGGQKSGGIQFVSFMPQMKEMEYVATRDELRQRISSYMGVSNVFMGDTSTSGGLNNEGTQLIVTNRAADRGQRPYNDVHFPFLMRLLGVKSKKCRLLPSEERDEMAELQREAQKIANAQAMKEMGFGVSRNELGEFKFTDEPEEPEPSPFDQPFGVEGDDRFGGEGADVSPPKPYESFQRMMKKYAGLNEQKKEARDVEEQLETAIDSVMSSATSTLSSTEPEAVKAWIEHTAKEIRRALEQDMTALLRGALDTGYTQVFRHMTKARRRRAPTVDRAFIAEVKGSPVWDSFAGIEDAVAAEMMDALKATMVEPEGFSVDRMVARMGQAVDVQKYRLENIARTESHSMVLRGKELAFKEADPADKWNYDWLGPSDHRTTPICKAIKARVKKEGKGRGVKLARLKQIVKEESEKVMGQGWMKRDWPPHYQCRHTAAKVSEDE